jgi:hemerythrin
MPNVSQAYASVHHDDYEYIETIGARLSRTVARSPYDIAAIRGVLMALKHALGLHFMIQENIMDEFDYQRKQVHKMIHTFILGELSSTIDDLTSGTEPRVQCLWLRLGAKLKDHAETYDADLLAFLDVAPIPVEFSVVTPKPPARPFAWRQSTMGLIRYAGNPAALSRHSPMP